MPSVVASCRWRTASRQGQLWKKNGVTATCVPQSLGWQNILWRLWKHLFCHVVAVPCHAAACMLSGSAVLWALPWAIPWKQHWGTWGKKGFVALFPQQEHRALCVEEEKGSAYLMAVQEDPKAATGPGRHAAVSRLCVRAGWAHTGSTKGFPGSSLSCVFPSHSPWLYLLKAKEKDLSL